MLGIIKIQILKKLIKNFIAKINKITIVIKSKKKKY